MNSTKEPPRNFSDFLKPVFRHKIMALVILLAVALLAYFGFQGTKNPTAMKYTLGTVSKGTLIVSVSGTGQVGVSSQVEIKPRASGDLTGIAVTNGQSVKAGDTIATINTKDAEKAVRNATIALQNAELGMAKLKKAADSYTVSQARSALEQAKIDLKKLTGPPTAYELLLAENTVTQAGRDLEKAKDDLTKLELDGTQELEKAYDDGFTAVSNAYLDLPQIKKDAYSVQYNENSSYSHDNLSSYRLLLGENSAFITSYQDAYETADDLFNESFKAFKNVTRADGKEEIYSLIDKTYQATEAVSDAIESSRNLLDAIINKEEYTDFYIAPTVDSLSETIDGDISIINNHFGALQTAKDNIDRLVLNTPINLKNAQAAIVSAEEKLKEKTAALADLRAGATAEDIALAQEKVKQQEDSLADVLAGSDPLDIKAQELAIEEKKNGLLDAQQTLADYTITAPFDGIIATVGVAKGDTVSSGTSIATLITSKLLAEVSLNEVDVAKVKTGQKATLTFDAVEDLSISGIVAEIDTLGTASQGVVTYNVKIAFDTQDSRIKPGMSTSAIIITEVKTDALLIPNSAVKTQGELRYVETFSGIDANTETLVTTAQPERKEVEAGLSDDTNTEINSGLSEGDIIVTKTGTNGTSSSSSSSTRRTNGLMIPGMGGGPPG